MLAAGKPRLDFRPGEEGPRSEAEWSAPWKRSFCSSGQDKSGTVSRRGPCPSLAQPSWFVSPSPPAARPNLPARTGAVSAAVFPTSAARPAPAVKLPALSLSAAGPFGAGAFGPLKHHVAPRGVRRCRRTASRLQSGTLTACGRRRPDPGGGRGVGHYPWFASERFSDHVTGLSVVGLIGGHRAAVANGFQKYFSSSSSCSGPRNTWNHVQGQGSAPEIPRRVIFLHGDGFRGGWGFLGGPVWQGMGIIATESQWGYGSIDARRLCQPFRPCGQAVGSGRCRVSHRSARSTSPFRCTRSEPPARR